MDKSIKNRQDVTARRVGGRKILILSATGAALAVDIAVIIMLAAAGITASGYLACPIIMLIVDVLFLLFAVFSNFRFKYSLVGAIVFAVIEAILTLIMFASHAGGARAMTSAALGLWTAAHCAVVAAVIVLAIDGASMGRIFNRAATVVAGVLGVLLIGYVAFALSFGVFGQGSGARTLTFTADGDGYTVSGVVKGRGNAIIIPRSFDGKPVTAVDCSVFCEDGIEEIYLDTDDAPELKNVSALVDFRDIPVRVFKDNVKNVRNDYFARAYLEKNAALTNFASAIEPTGLAKNEVFITYKYDVNTLRDINGKVLPVWIGSKNDVFKVSDLTKLDGTGTLDYASHSDYNSDDDLEWCHRLGRGMLDVSSAGLTLNNTQIASSVVGATPEFLKVFAVKIGEDNDDKFELPDSFKKTTVSGQIDPLEYRLTTIKTANRLTLSAPERDGFELSWQRLKSGNRVTFDSLAEELQAAQSDVVIYPYWTMKAPTVSRLDVEWTGDNAAVYGDPLTLTPTVDKGVTEGFEFGYSWSKPSSDGETDANGVMHIDVVKMDCAGNYTLTVTKSSPTSSLTATATYTTAVRVNKRPLSFIWQEFTDPHYDGTIKEMRCAYNGTQVVAGDTITFGRNIAAVTNAGTYTASVTLTGDCAYKYVVDDSATHKYTVLQRELKLDWAETIEYTYDGNTHLPEYTYRSGFDPISGDNVQAYTLGSGKSAGTYTAMVYIRNDNYTIAEGATKQYTVKKREIGDVTFSSPSEGYTYNGEVQMPTVATVANYADGEAELLKKLVSDNLQKSGDCIHAREYTLIVTLPEDYCNYSVPAVRPSISFTIKKKPTTVKVNNITAVYGEKYNYSYTASGVLSGDSLAIMYFVNNIEAHNGEKRDVGEYTITAVASNSDYIIEEIETGTLKITERTLDIYAFDATKVYDGKPYKGFQGSVGGAGFASGDSYSEVIASFTYLCDGVNASETPYVITPSYTLTEGKGKNYNLSYHTGKLTITKADLVVKINDRTHVYDGNVPSGGTVSAVSGLAEGETVATAGLGIYYVTPNVPNVDTYTVTGIGTSNNYNVTVQPGTLTITPRPITIEWNDDTFTYDGNSHLPTIKNINNLVDGKTPKISITGSQVNAGNGYVATATLDRSNNQYSGNYVIESGATTTFDIEKATATFTWSGKTEYALGEAVSIGAVCSISGLGYALVYYDASGDAFMGAPTAVGSYTVRAVITNNNYAPVNGEFTFEIKEATDGGQNV